MPRIPANPDTSSSPPFEEDLRLSLSGFRAALAEAIVAVRADATRPQHLARGLGLDKSLAWHLSKILTEPTLLATASHMPGRSGLRIVTESIERAGAAPPVLAQLRDAVDRFERMVDRHCGSRATLRIMTNGLATGEGSKAAGDDEINRRRLVEGSTGVWGVHADLQVSAQFLVPTRGNGRTFDLLTAVGLVGLRRLREDVAWTLATLRLYDDDGTPRPNDAIEPVDLDLADGEPALVRDFCSRPVPTVRAVRDAHRATRYEIAEGPVGATGACTCVAAWINRGVAEPWRTASDRFGEHLLHVGTPTDLVVHDLFIHRDLPFAAPTAHIYSQLPGLDVYPLSGRDRGLLPLTAPVVDLGTSRPDVALPEFPEYRRLFEAMATRLACRPEDLRGHRLRLRYPPLPTLLVLRHLLPDRPR